MRPLLAVGLLVVAACSSSAPPPTATALASAAAAATACGSPLRPLTHASATTTLLSHRVGDLTVFGMNGAFLASAQASPPGAQVHWWEMNSDGPVTRTFDWDILGRVLQSPDGAHIAYRAIDPATGEAALFLRDLKGAYKLLAPGEWSPQSWPTADVLYVTADDQPGFTYRLDTRTLARDVVLGPPPSPPEIGYFDDEWSLLSGDGLWAVVLRDNDDDIVIESYLYDVNARVFTDAQLPLGDLSLSPRGDVMVWIAGHELRAMHLCDRKAVTLAELGSVHGPLVGGIRWSPDGRFFSATFGVTDPLRGPQSVVIADLARGVIAQLDDPWGFVSRWSPDGAYVVLTRGGSPRSADRLARLAFK